MRPVTIRCAHPDCREHAYYEVRTKAEDLELRRKPWLCVRHSRPDAVLSNESPAKRQVLVSYEEPYGRFWRPEGSEKGGSGFAHGPGFKAFADDFPAGTRLVVESRLEFPAGEPDE